MNKQQEIQNDIDGINVVLGVASKALEDSRLKINELQKRLDAVQAEPDTWPKKGDEIWFVNPIGVATFSYWSDSQVDKYRLMTGNCFKTEQEAIYHKQMQELAFSLRPDFEPDWDNGKQKKYKIGWDYEINARRVDFNIVVNYGTLAFPSQEGCEKAFENVSDEDLKYIIGKGMV